MSSNNGKIIAILGAPASGKSTLLRSLEARFEIIAIYEGEENDLPDYIKLNLATRTHMLETLLWFQIRGIENMARAKAEAKQGKTVILDTCWLSSWFFIDASLDRKEEKTLFESLMRASQNSQQLPDTFLYIKANHETLHERTLRRSRSFELGLAEFIQAINTKHEQILSEQQSIFNNRPILVIHAEKHDIETLGDALGLQRKQ